MKQTQNTLPESDGRPRHGPITKTFLHVLRSVNPYLSCSELLVSTNTTFASPEHLPPLNKQNLNMTNTRNLRKIKAKPSQKPLLTLACTAHGSLSKFCATTLGYCRTPTIFEILCVVFGDPEDHINMRILHVDSKAQDNGDFRNHDFQDPCCVHVVLRPVILGCLAFQVLPYTARTRLCFDPAEAHAAKRSANHLAQEVADARQHLPRRNLLQHCNVVLCALL